MNLVDSCGWVEYLTDGPNADYFATAIEDMAHLLVPTICLLEVFKLTLRERGENAALRSLVTMRRGRVVDLDADIAVEAARLSLLRLEQIMATQRKAEEAEEYRLRWTAYEAERNVISMRKRW